MDEPLPEPKLVDITLNNCENVVLLTAEPSHNKYLLLVVVAKFDETWLIIVPTGDKLPLDKLFNCC